jgi:hypothetical protein
MNDRACYAPHDRPHHRPHAHAYLRALKLEIAGRRRLKDEAKVNVQQVALVRDHNIAIVPILDLQNVGGHRRTRGRHDKVALRATKGGRIGRAVSANG